MIPAAFVCYNPHCGRWFFEQVKRREEAEFEAYWHYRQLHPAMLDEYMGHSIVATEDDAQQVLVVMNVVAQELRYDPFA